MCQGPFTRVQAMIAAFIRGLPETNTGLHCFSWICPYKFNIIVANRQASKLGLCIFDSVCFWIKINNQTNFILFLVLEPKNRFSVRFGFFPFQTGSNRNFYTCFHFPKNQLQFSLDRKSVV